MSQDIKEIKIRFERQVERLKQKLEKEYSYDYSGKSIHYFEQKGVLEGMIYAYENILDYI